MTKTQLIYQVELDLEDFNIPPQRKRINKNNTLWLLKNLDKLNSEHPKYNQVIKNLQIILDNGLYFN